MLKVRLLKGLDRIFGTAAAGCLARPEPAEIREPHRVLIIRPGGIGDAVLLIPALRALAQRFPNCSITVLAERRNASIFSLCGAVSRTLLYDRYPDLWHALRGTYDVVIDTEQWHRLSAVIARLTGARILIGFDTNCRRRLFTHTVGYSHDSYELNSFFSLVELLGIAAPEVVHTPFLDVPETAAIRASEKLGELAGKQFVALFPGASIPERRWGTERFRNLAERLRNHGMPVVVIGGAGDAPSGDAIVAGGLGVSLAGKTSLAETAGVLAMSRLLVTGDSGVLHIAVGLGVPTVSLFGPGIERKWAPRGDAHRVLNKHLDCSPCTRFGYTPHCRIGARCLATIGSDEVENAVFNLLAGIRQGIFDETEQFP